MFNNEIETGLTVFKTRWSITGQHRVLNIFPHNGNGWYAMVASVLLLFVSDDVQTLFVISTTTCKKSKSRKI